MSYGQPLTEAVFTGAYWGDTVEPEKRGFGIKGPFTGKRVYRKILGDTVRGLVRGDVTPIRLSPGVRVAPGETGTPHDSLGAVLLYATEMYIARKTPAAAPKEARQENQVERMLRLTTHDAFMENVSTGLDGLHVRPFIFSFDSPDGMFTYTRSVNVGVVAKTAFGTEICELEDLRESMALPIAHRGHSYHGFPGVIGESVVKTSHPGDDKLFTIGRITEVDLCRPGTAAFAVAPAVQHG